MRTLIGLITLLDDRRGITAVEYALMGALIAAGIVTAVTTLQVDVVAVFGTIGAAL